MAVDFRGQLQVGCEGGGPAPHACCGQVQPVGSGRESCVPLASVPSCDGPTTPLVPGLQLFLSLGRRMGRDKAGSDLVAAIAGGVLFEEDTAFLGSR